MTFGNGLASKGTEVWWLQLHVVLFYYPSGVDMEYAVLVVEGGWERGERKHSIFTRRVWLKKSGNTRMLEASLFVCDMSSWTTVPGCVFEWWVWTFFFLVCSKQYTGDGWYSRASKHTRHDILKLWEESEYNETSVSKKAEWRKKMHFTHREREKTQKNWQNATHTFTQCEK